MDSVKNMILNVIIELWYLRFTTSSKMAQMFVYSKKAELLEAKEQVFRHKLK